MRSKQFAIGACAAAAIGAAVVAGCGGGGSSALPGPGPNPSPSVAPTPSTSPNPTPSASPVLQALGMQVATGGTVASGFMYSPAPMTDMVVFSCGCFPVAGTAPMLANGAFMVVSPATPTPAPGNSPYVMVAGRNYIVVAQPVNGSGPQGWTFMFEGNAPAHTLGLGDSGSVLASAALSDVYTTAAALYVYRQSGQCGVGGCETAFDDWNFNTVQKWLQHLNGTLPGDPSPGPNTVERTLLNDIAAQSAASASLFPKSPKWNPSQPTNPTIASDLNAVGGSDSLLPTPCPSGPSGCTGTPTP